MWLGVNVAYALHQNLTVKSYNYIIIYKQVLNTENDTCAYTNITIIYNYMHKDSDAIFSPSDINSSFFLILSAVLRS